MGFRDDREAMRAHVETLKEQLDEQREANAELEKKIDALSKRMDRLEPAPKSPAARQRTALIVAAAVLVGGVVVGILLSRSPEAKPSAEAERPAEPKPPAEPQPRPATPPTQAVAETSPAPQPEPAPAPNDPPEASATYDGMAEWAGTVSAIEGRDDLSVGDGCVVRAEGRSLAYRLAPERLEVRCGEVLLYERAVSRRQPSNPFERWECNVRGQRESEGGLYALRCSDRGVREDRPELELDTASKQARLWTDELSVEIALEHSAVRTPERMNPNIEMSLPVREGLRRSGEVLRSSGPVSAGASCQLTLEVEDHRDDWEGRHENCRAMLRCGGRTVLRQRVLCLVDSDLQLTGLRIVDEESPVAVQGDLDTLNVASIGAERTWHAVIRFADD